MVCIFWFQLAFMISVWYFSYWIVKDHVRYKLTLLANKIPLRHVMVFVCIMGTLVTSEVFFLVLYEGRKFGIPIFSALFFRF